MIRDFVVLLHYFMSNTFHGRSVYFLAQSQTPKDLLYNQMQLMQTFCVVNQFFAAQQKYSQKEENPQFHFSAALFRLSRAQFEFITLPLVMH